MGTGNMITCIPQRVKLCLFQNNVVILDEAHNVEKICEESVSVRIRSTDVALCIQEITKVRKRQRKSESRVFLLSLVLLGFSVWNAHRVIPQKFIVYI